MVTTMCALLGALPVALGWGWRELQASARDRRGLVVSQMLTLFTTPVIICISIGSAAVWLAETGYRHRPGVLVPGGAGAHN